MSVSDLTDRAPRTDRPRRAGSSPRGLSPAWRDPLLVPRSVVVREVIDEAPDVVTLRVVSTDGPLPSFEPAQVSMIGAFGVGEVPISISSSPTAPHHDYTIRRGGRSTSALVELVPGDVATIRSPFGEPWRLHDLEGRDVVVVAGGIGLAPLRAAVLELVRHRERYGRVVLVVGAWRPVDLLFAREYDTWRRSIEVITTVDDADADWRGRTQLAPDVLDDIDLWWSRAGAMLCGPDVMMRVAAERLASRGMRPDRIQLTLERNMRCGNALCGHCQLGPILVCRDGPVVRYPTVARALDTPGL